jgi:hypothetical protein
MALDFAREPEQETLVRTEVMKMVVAREVLGRESPPY